MDYEHVLANYGDVLLPEDIMKILKIGRASVYRELREKNIPSIRIANKYRIPKTLFLAYLNGEIG